MKKKSAADIINAVERGEEVLCDTCKKGHWRKMDPGWKFNSGYKCDNPKCDEHIEVCGPSMETLEEWERECEKAISILTEWEKETMRSSRDFVADFWITEFPHCFKFAPCGPNGEKWYDGGFVYVTKDEGKITFKCPDDKAEELKIRKKPVHIDLGILCLKYKNRYKVDEEKHCYVLEEDPPEKIRKSFEKWQGLYGLTDGEKEPLSMAQRMQSLKDLETISDVWDGKKILCEECGNAYYVPVTSKNGKSKRCMCEKCGYLVITGPISEASVG